MFGVLRLLPSTLVGETYNADLDDDGDINNGLHPDGGVDINDLNAFLALFQAGDPRGDMCDNTGWPIPDAAVDLNDLIHFLQLFEGGVRSATTDARFAWRGYQWDPYLNIYHVRNRVFDPSLVSWLQPDPLGEIDGPNVYAYVGWDPFNKIDPYGLEDVSVGEILSAAWNQLPSWGDYWHSVALGVAEVRDGFPNVTDQIAQRAVITEINAMGGDARRVTESGVTFNVVSILVGADDIVTGATGDDIGTEVGRVHVIEQWYDRGGRIAMGVSAMAGTAALPGQAATAVVNAARQAANTALVFLLKNPSVLAAVPQEVVNVIVSWSGKTQLFVVGRYAPGTPEHYVTVADKLGAGRFNVPDNVWNYLVATGRASAQNLARIDQAIANGSKIVLTEDLEAVVPNSMLGQEIRYLISRGYRIGPDGRTFLPPGGSSSTSAPPVWPGPGRDEPCE